MSDANIRNIVMYYKFVKVEKYAQNSENVLIIVKMLDLIHEGTSFGKSMFLKFSKVVTKSTHMPKIIYNVVGL